MLIDGRKIAQNIKEELKKELSDKHLSLGVFVMTDDLATQKFIEIKKQFAADIGVTLTEERLDNKLSTEEVVEKVRQSAESHKGIIVQLPLAPHIDTDVVRNAVPASHDVDVISDAAFEEFSKGTSRILPPVVGAIAEMVRCHGISIKGKRTVVVGKGSLVGKPAVVWFQSQGAEVSAVGKSTTDLAEHTKSADILVLGAGVPGLVTPDMIKEGVVIFDAGTSEAAGRLAGDADPRCADRASFLTPVPGGIGPLTIALIFKNLLGLSKP